MVNQGQLHGKLSNICENCVKIDIAWWEERLHVHLRGLVQLDKQLQKLKFTRHPPEPCVFMPESGSGQDRVLHGVIGTHVDDGVCGGDQFFHDQLGALKRVLPFG